MGSWTAAVYTPEQQARLGVNEQGEPMAAPLAAAPQQRTALGLSRAPIGLAGPAWTRGEMEKPAGEKSMGTWTAAVYTEEQQARLGVNEQGERLA